MICRAIKSLGIAITGLALVAPTTVLAAWVKDGVPICSSAGDQWYGHIAPDGMGGAYIVWDEVRSAVAYDFDIFAQHVDKDGNILWDAEGVPICVMPGGQLDPVIIQDGSGGVVIAWRDQRDANFRVYVQRIDGEGRVLWTQNGVSVSSNVMPEYGPRIVPDGQGDFYVAWRDDGWGYGQVYCQKLDSGGNPLWVPEGIRVSPTLGWEDLPFMISDAKDGVILAWHDERGGFLSHYIYAQHLDGAGSLLWGAAGAPICLFDYYKWSLDCIADGQGGGIVAWHGPGYGGGGGYEVFAQRFDSTGAILWLASGVPICQAPGDQIRPHLASDDLGGAILGWLDNRDGRDDIYAQRVAADGSVRWQTDGLIVQRGPVSSGFGYSVPAIIRDGKGGAILSWQEGPGANYLWDILAQRVDGDGNLLWPDSAVSVCSAPGGQYLSSMKENGDGGAIIAWRDMRNGADQNGVVYAMRVTDKGETVATLLQSYSARMSGSSSVMLEWRLSEIDPDVQFHVLRCQAENEEYQELDQTGIQRNGLSFSFTDKSCEPGKTYKYRVDLSDSRGRRMIFESQEIALPSLPLALFQNYPNPFNPSTNISYCVPIDCQVTLDIYDSSGKLINKLLDKENKSAGKHIAEWRGVDDQGRSVSSGVYFYRLRAGKETISKKMVLLK